MCLDTACRCFVPPPPSSRFFPQCALSLTLFLSTWYFAFGRWVRRRAKRTVICMQQVAAAASSSTTGTLQYNGKNLAPRSEQTPPPVAITNNTTKPLSAQS
ncbi:hypothetical protein IF2G_02955 [Cordyceps javanica]|nr:hypothetical protein IF2G_02955 [Cordyceps javanica]